MPEVSWGDFFGILLAIILPIKSLIASAVEFLNCFFKAVLSASVADSLAS